MPDGRFVPSPTGPLHLGNLRTALLAWLFARNADSRFRLRIDDLDQVASRPEHVASAIADLAALGLDHDGPVTLASDRADAHRDALDRLIGDDRAYPCFCTRREILAEVEASVAAPHGPLPAGAYPGTCGQLDVAGRAEREAAGRRPSWRLRAEGAVVTFQDRVAGAVTGSVDDFVIQRADGAPAYNVAVVVDDDHDGVGEVVRGDDLLQTTPRQIVVAGLLGVGVPAYAHVPLVLGPDGERLAKRHGSVTLSDQIAAGRSVPDVLGRFGASLGLCDQGEPVTASILLARFDPEDVPHDPWTLPPEVVSRAST